MSDSTSAEWFALEDRASSSTPSRLEAAKAIAAHEAHERLSESRLVVHDQAAGARRWCERRLAGCVTQIVLEELSCAN